MEYFSIIRFIYLLIGSVVPLIIYFTTKKLYRLSTHRGIKHFSNAFLYFGLGFLIELIYLGLTMGGLNIHYTISTSLIILARYFLSLSGFYLVYSLIWKDLENCTKKYIILKNIALHLFALTISIIATISTNTHFLFIPQLAVLSFGALISYNNYINLKSAKYNFKKVYFIVFILMIIGWSLEYLNTIIQNKIFTVYAMLIVSMIFLLFLYGVIRVINKKW